MYERLRKIALDIKPLVRGKLFPNEIGTSLLIPKRVHLKFVCDLLYNTESITNCVSLMRNLCDLVSKIDENYGISYYNSNVKCLPIKYKSVFLHRNSPFHFFLYGSFYVFCYLLESCVIFTISSRKMTCYLIHII